MNKLIYYIIIFLFMACSNSTNYIEIDGERYVIEQILNKAVNERSNIIFITSNNSVIEIDFPYRLDKLECCENYFKLIEDDSISCIVHKNGKSDKYNNIYGILRIDRSIGSLNFTLDNGKNFLKCEYLGDIKDYDKSIEYIVSIPEKKTSPFKNYVEINNQFYEVERVLQREQEDTCVMFFINNNNYGVELFIPKNISKLVESEMNYYFLDKKGVKYITYTKNGKEEHYTSRGRMLVCKKGEDTDFYFSISNIKGSYIGKLNTCISSAMNYVEIKKKQFDIETAKYEKREKGCSIKFFYNKEIEIEIYKDLLELEGILTIPQENMSPIYISRENDIFNFNIETISGKDTVKIEYMGELKGQELVKIELKEKIE